MPIDLSRFRGARDQASQARETPATPARVTGYSQVRGGGAHGAEQVSLAKTLLRTSYNASPELRRYQSACDDLHIAKSMLTAACELRREDPSWVDDALLSSPMGMAQAMAAVDLSKAMDTATANEGLEFIPNEFSSQFIDRFRLEMKISAMHEHFTMPRSPWTLPIAGADPVARRIPENLTDNIFLNTALTPAITPVTGNQQFVAATLGAMVLISRDLEMDSIVPVVQFARTRLTVAAVRAIENATINGSRWNAVHIDADVEADANKVTRSEVLWDGYRQIIANRAAVDAGCRRDFAGNAISTKLLRTLRKELGIYGVNPEDLMYVVSPSGHAQMLDLDELLTVDKLGPNATIVKGQVGTFDGSAVVVSEHQRQDLEATGYAANPAAGTTTLVQVIHRPSFQYGDLQSLQWNLIDWAPTRQKVAMLDMRLDFRAVVDDPTAVTFAAEGFNIPA